VQNNQGDLEKRSPEWQVAPPLAPQAREVLIEKHSNSSFEETSLEETLANLGATRIVLAGTATNWCIRATAYAALERGYDLTLIADSYTTHDLETEEGATIPAAHIIQELNTILGWVRSPGRESRVVAVDKLAF
jgi:nicotinamidase-related amidase